jgi:hypothetical protein
MNGQSLNPGKGKIFMFSMVSRPILQFIQPSIHWLLAVLSRG